MYASRVPCFMYTLMLDVLMYLLFQCFLLLTSSLTLSLRLAFCHTFIRLTLVVFVLSLFTSWCCLHESISPVSFSVPFPTPFCYVLPHVCPLSAVCLPVCLPLPCLLCVPAALHPGHDIPKTCYLKNAPIHIFFVGPVWCFCRVWIIKQSLCTLGTFWLPT